MKQFTLALVSEDGTRWTITIHADSIEQARAIAATYETADLSTLTPKKP